MNLRQDTRVLERSEESLYKPKLMVRQEGDLLKVDNSQYGPARSSISSNRYSPGRDRIKSKGSTMNRSAYRPTAPPKAHRDRIVQQGGERKPPKQKPSPSQGR